MESITIDMENLANRVLDNFEFLIHTDELRTSNTNYEDIQDMIMNTVAPLTPIGFIIKEANLEHLIDDLNVHLILEIEKRINDLKKSWGKEEKKVATSTEFEVEVEADGF